MGAALSGKGGSSPASHTFASGPPPHDEPASQTRRRRHMFPPMLRGLPILNWMTRAATLVVVAAFLLRAAIPQGFMPEVNRVTGEITVAICSGDGAHKTMTIAVPVEKPAKPASRTCDYAVAMAAILPPHATVAEAAQAHVFKTALTAQPQAPPAQPWPAHAPPTGPPAQA